MKAPGRTKAHGRMKAPVRMKANRRMKAHRRLARVPEPNARPELTQQREENVDALAKCLLS